MGDPLHSNDRDVSGLAAALADGQLGYGLSDAYYASARDALRRLDERRVVAAAIVEAARALSRFRAGVETWTTDDVALEGDLLTALDGALAAYDAEEARRG